MNTRVTVEYFFSLVFSLFICINPGKKKTTTQLAHTWINQLNDLLHEYFSLYQCLFVRSLKLKCNQCYSVFFSPLISFEWCFVWFFFPSRNFWPKWKIVKTSHSEASFWYKANINKFRKCENSRKMWWKTRDAQTIRSTRQQVRYNDNTCENICFNNCQ